jgi:hypothetical protein
VKLCGRCGTKKPLSDFHRSSRHGQQAWCKRCRQEYDREYHQRTRSIRLAQKKRRHQEIWAWYVALKRKPCADCGKAFPPAAMAWDHLPGRAKVSEVSLLVRRRFGKRAILAEIAKCELVCANCHAVRSQQRRGVAQPG